MRIFFFILKNLEQNIDGKDRKPDISSVIAIKKHAHSNK